LRLSALGDISHVLPVVRTLQYHWPDTRISWIIGQSEYELVRHVAGVEFITFDKSAGVSAYLAMRRRLRGEQFDLLLHMQVALRASIISLMVRAGIKLGFDAARAKDLQSLFCNQQIKATSSRQHVVDSFLEFPRTFGLSPRLHWDLPVEAEALASASNKLGDALPMFVINACAVAKSRNWRNWHAEGYAAVADYVANRHGLRVVLSGGPGSEERAMAAKISSLCQLKPLNLVGNTSLAELTAVLKLATAVLAPDTGPAHIASALGTPVIGLYAATNPQRAGPSNYLDYVVNKYPEALHKYNSTTVEDAPWGTRIRNDECMSLITVDEVTAMVDRVLQETKTS
jgi:heptosyltransferase I